MLPFLVLNDNCGDRRTKMRVLVWVRRTVSAQPWGSPLPAWCSFTPQCTQGWHQAFVTPVTTSRLCCCDCLLLKWFMPKKQVCGPVHSTSVSPQWAALLWGYPSRTWAHLQVLPAKLQKTSTKNGKNHWKTMNIHNEYSAGSLPAKWVAVYLSSSQHL